MRLTELTDAEIVMCLSQLAINHDVKLTIGQKTLYLFLLHLAEHKGEFDEESNRYFIQMSLVEIGDERKVGTTFVQNALKLLCKCGAIEREDRGKSLHFKKFSNYTYRKNVPIKTYINLDFLKTETE